MAAGALATEPSPDRSGAPARQQVEGADDLWALVHDPGTPGLGMGTLAVCVVDAAGRIRRVNPCYLRMTGFSEDEVRGRPMRFRDLASGPGEEPAGDELDGGARNPADRHGARRGVVRSIRRSGQPFLEDRIVLPLRDRTGSATGHVVLSRDLTTEREWEQRVIQAQKIDLVGRFAGAVAHDFNNLLTVISSHVEMALERLGDDSPLRDEIEGIAQVSNRAAALVHQLFTLSHRRPCSTSSLRIPLATDAMESLLRRLLRADIRLRLDVDRDLWPVPLDRTRFEQLLVNLLVNARDAMPEGGSVTVRGRNVPGRDGGLGDGVLLSVSDTGVGIPPDRLDRLFEPFFSSKEAGRGSGLGLTIVAAIVTQAGGEIQVESAPGEGSTFHIRLPRRPEQEGEEIRSQTAPAGPEVERHRGTERILLVEDHELVRLVTRSTMEECGYQVDTVGKGEDALILARDQGVPFDLVIIDLVLPGMRGGELAWELRSLDPTQAILYMTGLRDGSHPAEPPPPGPPIPLIEKPFTPGDLVEAVRRCLDEADTPARRSRIR